MPRPAAWLLALGLVLGQAPVFAGELEQAQKLWLAGQRPQALGLLEQSLAKTPNDLKLRFALGVMRMEQGELKQAQAIFTQLSQDFPDLADPYNNLAVIHASQGELDLAQAALNQALSLQADHAQALENLADLLLRQAEKAYQRALKAQATPSANTSTKLRLTQSLLREMDARRP
ncbi:Flp pilus assembly protein TadD [Paucibacter oligotrophus]|uniref:Flp pilus assembly protein TadD n=1 Tax=Roseateles oligotrophus TaxID=1769250 RepID=A0A840L216_9BURK|nr:Flp pilus assembly protein TadD [Roseateles oligotrophus]